MIRKEDIQPRDILCIRGNGVINNPGNVFYTKVVKENRSFYQEAPCWKEKKVVIQQVLDAIRSGDPPGRFLRVCEESDKHWEELSDEAEIVKKVAQALREKRNVKSTTTSSRGSCIAEREKTVQVQVPSTRPVQEEGLKTQRNSSDDNARPEQINAQTIEIGDKVVVAADTDPPRQEKDGKYSTKKKRRARKKKKKVTIKRRRTSNIIENTTSDGFQFENTFSDDCGPAVVSHDGEQQDKDEDETKFEVPTCTDQTCKDVAEDSDRPEENGNDINDLRILNPNFQFPGDKIDCDESFYVISVDDDHELNSLLLSSASTDHTSPSMPLPKDFDDISVEFDRS